MKTLRYFFIAFASLSILASCSKKSDDAVNPDVGAELAGSYNVTKVRMANGQMGTVQAGFTKTIRLTRVSETQVDLTLRFEQPGKSPLTVEFKEYIELKRSGRTTNLYAPDGVSQIGSYNDGTIELKVNDTSDGFEGTFFGQKQ